MFVLLVLLKILHSERYVAIVLFHLIQALICDDGCLTAGNNSTNFQATEWHDSYIYNFLSYKKVFWANYSQKCSTFS
jgi:hypothetical protein